MADLSIELPDRLGERLFRVVDVEGKLLRTLDALGPLAGRDVLLFDGATGRRARQLRELGARVALANDGSDGIAGTDGSADIVVSLWSGFRGSAPSELAAAERILRPGGRLLVVHDYGRDDVSHLLGERPEYGAWSRRGGPFLGAGFKVRVVHCFWTFESMADCREFLEAAFGEPGRAVAARLTRPRLSYKVAIYHRTFGVVPDAVDAEGTFGTVAAQSTKAPESATAIGPAEAAG